MMRVVKRSRGGSVLVAAFAAIAMLAAACSSSGGGGTSDNSTTGATSQATGAQKLQTLVYGPGTATPTAKFVPLFYGIDKGIFKKYGLKIDVKLLSPAATIPALVSGSIDMAGAGEGVITAIAKSGSGKVVGTTGYVLLQVWTPKKTTTAAQLKGGTIAATAPGGTIDAATKGYITSNGMTPGSDVKIVYLHSTSAELTALKTGKVDAAVLSPPATVEAAKDADIHSIAEISKEARPTPLSVNGKFYANHKDLVKAYIEARKESIDDMQNDVSGAVAALMKNNPTVDKATAEASIKQYLADYAVQPYTDKDAAAVLAGDPGTKSIDPSTIVDNSLVNAVGGVGAD